KGLWKLLLEDRPPGGVGARLKDRPETMRRISMPQCAQGFTNCRWVMPKIVDYRDPARFAANLLPARDSLEACQSSLDNFGAEAVEARRHGRHRSVAHVEFAD